MQIIYTNSSIYQEDGIQSAGITLYRLTDKVVTDFLFIVAFYPKC